MDCKIEASITVIVAATLAISCAFNVSSKFQEYRQARVPRSANIDSFLELEPSLQQSSPYYSLREVPRKRETISRGVVLELCETVSRQVILADDGYEYKPPHYTEKWCKGGLGIYGQLLENQRCLVPGSACVQRYKVVHVVRRRFTETCWELETRLVPSGCDCVFNHPR